MIGKNCFHNFVRAIEFSDTLIRLTAFQSFARMWILLNLKATMDSAQAKALIAKHTVIEPIEFYIEVDGGS